MAAFDLINLSGLIDDAKCFAFVRQHRWPEGARCPVCDSGAVSGTATTTRSPSPALPVQGVFRALR